MQLGKFISWTTVLLTIVCILALTLPGHANPMPGKTAPNYSLNVELTTAFDDTSDFGDTKRSQGIAGEFSLYELFGSPLTLKAGGKAAFSDFAPLAHEDLWFTAIEFPMKNRGPIFFCRYEQRFRFAERNSRYVAGIRMTLGRSRD